MFKLPTQSKNIKQEDNTKKWKRLSVPLNRFELVDVSDLKIIDELILKLLMSLEYHRNMVYCN